MQSQTVSPVEKPGLKKHFPVRNQTVGSVATAVKVSETTEDLLCFFGSSTTCSNNGVELKPSLFDGNLSRNLQKWSHLVVGMRG